MKKTTSGEIIIDLEGVLFGKEANVVEKEIVNGYDEDKKKREKEKKRLYRITVYDKLNIQEKSSVMLYFFPPFYYDISISMPPRMSLITPNTRQLNMFPIKNLKLRSLKLIKKIENIFDSEDLYTETLKSQKENSKLMLDVCMNESQIESLDNFLYLLMNFIGNMLVLLGENSGNINKRKIKIKLKDTKAEEELSKDGKNIFEYSKILMPSSLQLAAHNIVGDIGPIVGTVHRPLIIGEIEKELTENKNDTDNEYEESNSLKGEEWKKTEIIENLTLINNSSIPPLQSESDYYITVSPDVYERLKLKIGVIKSENNILQNILSDIVDEKKRIFDKITNL
jgi:hypothetical protein